MTAPTVVVIGPRRGPQRRETAEWRDRLRAALAEADRAYSTFFDRSDGYPWVGLKPDVVITLQVAAAHVLDALDEALGEGKGDT